MDISMLEEMCELIKKMRRDAEALKAKGKGIMAVEKAVDRILANVNLLEINVCDVKEVL
ncbi:MAG: hypothetical protein JRI79_08415 [Deltaproteobacteria bacterium]|nr:hypothetical protein [Deltaproteobacteria bacterium]MBW1919850.1 hypothetical protein [Deltaproteobacteria bacterium]MBW1936447.1 hypothetical protein [Deltaproteobacteria bacterium]MBW1977971.1 hypothetical protein [Deltaproteobacteria bacterium]MBW2045555.1 hypothetical protein [Deltaproteobacteria bacterium]